MKKILILLCGFGAAMLNGGVLTVDLKTSTIPTNSDLSPHEAAEPYWNEIADATGCEHFRVFGVQQNRQSGHTTFIIDCNAQRDASRSLTLDESSMKLKREMHFGHDFSFGKIERSERDVKSDPLH